MRCEGDKSTKEGVIVIKKVLAVIGIAIVVFFGVLIVTAWG